MDLVIKRIRENNLRHAVITSAGVVGFALLTCVGAAVRIPLPFSPVPITLQTFFVLLAGAFLGNFAGPVSQLVYLWFGIAGFTVFAGSGSGALYLCGPTGGYLAGFVLAALICGMTVRTTKGFAGLSCGFLLGSAVILVCGTLWLAFVTRLSLPAALAAGALPFVPGDIIKSLVAAAVFSRSRRSSRGY
jgi:biotin transport system substrate-specific component